MRGHRCAAAMERSPGRRPRGDPSLTTDRDCRCCWSSRFDCLIRIDHHARRAARCAAATGRASARRSVGESDPAHSAASDHLRFVMAAGPNRASADRGDCFRCCRRQRSPGVSPARRCWGDRSRSSIDLIRRSNGWGSKAAVWRGVGLRSRRLGRRCCRRCSCLHHRRRRGFHRSLLRRRRVCQRR